MNKLHWEQIPRANNPSKPLQEKAVNLLAVIVHKLRKAEFIILTHNYLTRITKCKKDQNVNLLRQLDDVLDISFHTKFTSGIKAYRNCYVIQHTEKGRSIIENSKVLLAQKHFVGNKLINPIKKLYTEDKKDSSCAGFFPSFSIYKEEVLENRSTESNFCKISFEEKKVDNSANQLVENEMLKGRGPNAIQIKGIFAKAKELKDFYPLTKEDCQSLQSLSKREFSLNAMNEILLDMSKRLADRVFNSKKAFLSYMSKVFTYEMRDAVKTSNEGFKINNNKTCKDITIEEQEKYLTEIEYNLQVSPEWHLKKKLACVFDTGKSYALLKAYRRIAQEGSLFTLHLDKHVELTKADKEIIFNQVKATHEIIDLGSDQIIMIENLEIIMPEKSVCGAKESRGQNDKNRVSSTTIPDTIWGKVRKSLISLYGEAVDRNWFSKLNAEVNEESRAIHLKAPTGFMRDFIIGEYLATIERITEKNSYGVQLI